MSVKVKIIYLISICLLILAAGCVKPSTMFHGNLISSVPVVTLQEGGPYAGRWETFDLIIDYEYKQAGDVFEISGQFALSDHYQMNYASITRMFVYLFFIDDDSRVLATIAFPGIWTGGTSETQAFSQSYKLPAGTTGVSFGYSGDVTERDDRASFYELPLEK